MTLYVSAQPHPTGAFLLWADETPAGYVLALGLDPEACRAPFQAWEAYLVPGEAFAAAVATFNAEVTDRFGPAEWCARRGGCDPGAMKLHTIAHARRHGAA